MIFVVDLVCFWKLLLTDRFIMYFANKVYLDKFVFCLINYVLALVFVSCILYFALEINMCGALVKEQL